MNEAVTQPLVVADLVGIAVQLAAYAFDAPQNSSAQCNNVLRPVAVLASVAKPYLWATARRQEESVEMGHPSSDIAFTAAVKAVQMRRGSRQAYAKREARGGFNTAITPDLTAFLSEVDTAYLATANHIGQPYVQHRGGPKGFIRIVDDKTLGFADYAGNRQYITIGNLAENDRAFLFLMDYANRRRVKLWGRARVVEDDPALIEALMPPGYRARPEQAILFTLEAWDVNCSQHIPLKFAAEDVAAVLSKLKARVDELTAENDRLRAVAASAGIAG